MLVNCAPLFQKLNQVPDGQAVPASLDNEFSRLADTVSKNWFAASIEIPVQRAIRLWWDWLGHSLPNSAVGTSTPSQTDFHFLLFTCWPRFADRVLREGIIC